MRLTPALCKQYLRYMFKQKWKIKSKKVIGDYGVPEDLKGLNVKVYDALEVVKPKKKITKVEPPDPYKINPYLIKGPGNPNWHDKHVYWFDRNSMLIEGDKQGRALTKTIGYEGFPSVLENIVNNLPEMEIEDLVQHCILESVLWDGVQEKLPKRFHPDKLMWVLRREFGISHNRKILNLMTRLLYLCERISAKSKNIASRMQIMDPKVKLQLNIEENPVFFEAINDPFNSPDILLSSNTPLPLLFDGDKVRETINEDIIDLYPVKPVVSLEKVNIYTEENIYPLNKDCYPHTLFISHDTLEDSSSSQKFARALGLTFSYAAAHARLLHGEQVGELPKPLVVQSVWSNDKNMGFLSYQLNTLQLEEKGGIKNQAFLDGPYTLYEQCHLKSGLVGYNHQVFLKMLAMYLNGF